MAEVDPQHLGLFTFNSMLGFLMSFVGIAFIVALIGSMCGMPIILIILTNRLILYLAGFVISFLNCFCYQQNNIFFIYGDYSPFFGSLVFSLTCAGFVKNMLLSNNDQSKDNNDFLMFIGGIIW